MKTFLSFVVMGVPVGKGRPRSARTGHGVRLYTPAETLRYQQEVVNAVERQVGPVEPKPGNVPLGVVLDMRFPIPESWSAAERAAALAGRRLPTVKPDVDNVEKAICDALNGVVWKDDAQIVYVEKQKRYSDEPRVRVEVGIMDSLE